MSGTRIPLTVVLPTYNGARFLQPQIESILAQTRPDFRLLVVDDGSTDESASIIDDYARRDRRVRRLASSGNAGQRGRLRQLVQATSTEHVAFADQDDLWRPDRNALLLDAIGDRAIAFGRSQLMDGEGRDLGRSILEELGIDPRRAGPLRSLFRPLVSAHAAIVRRSWLDVAVLTGPTAFDWRLGVEALLSTGLVYVDEAVVHHRVHGDNQTNGDLARPRRLLSGYRLRESTGFVRFDRFCFFLLSDQLSRSTALPIEVRRAFNEASDACRRAWYQPLDFKMGGGRRLERRLRTLLDGFAGSEDELTYFRKRVRSMTRSQMAPVNMAGAVARYFGGRP